MAGPSDKAILRDANQDPIPQYFDRVANDFAPLDKEPASEDTLDALKTELEAVKAELQTIKANQTSGDQKVQVSGSLPSLSAGTANIGKTERAARVVTATIINAVSVAAGAATTANMGLDGTESEVWVAINIDKQPWGAVAKSPFNNSAAGALYPSHWNFATAYATPGLPCLQMYVGVNPVDHGLAALTTLTMARELPFSAGASATLTVANQHATDAATVTAKVIRIWR